MSILPDCHVGKLLLFSTFIFISACVGSSGSDRQLSNNPAAPPPANTSPIAPQANVNIPNPTLTLLDTFPVSPNDDLTLVWSDEFDGAKLDPEIWFFETGDGTSQGIPGWGNNELQYYLPDNAQLADGLLTITARREQVGGFNFTSARINTRDRIAFRYGRIEARIRLPGGQGLWPAFWMLPQDSPYGGWPESGEIDIMEAINLGGTGGNDIFGTLHYSRPNGPGAPSAFEEIKYTVATNATENFHVYALEWDENEIRWYVDGILYAMQNSWFSTQGPFPAPFDHQFHIIFNVAVGGNFPGAPTNNTVFPVTMDVDWVRVYSGDP